MDLYRGSHSLAATFEVPGIRVENIKVETDAREWTLEVVVKKMIANERSREHYLFRHRKNKVKLSRNQRLPTDILIEGAEAKLEDGVLTVTFPLIPPEVSRRTIMIGADLGPSSSTVPIGSDSGENLILDCS